MSTPAFRRIVRRETHSPRTVAMIVASVIVILALLYVGVEIVLWLLSQPALLIGPGVAVAWIVGMPGVEPVALVVLVGGLIAVFGLILVVLGLFPGRLPKHQMSDAGRAVVVDNGVIASSLAQRISAETGIPRGDITVGVSHRAADVSVRSGFGDVYDAAPIIAVVDAELGGYGLIPSVTPRVRITRPAESDHAPREQSR